MKNGHTILVAEDDPNIRMGLIDALEGEGYDVRPAADGAEALQCFGQGGIDLILLDIMMPGKSGYDVCQAIRRISRSVPVILLTAKTEEIDKVVGLELGADDYVTKPFGVRELLARIKAALRRAGLNAGQAPVAARESGQYDLEGVRIDRKTYQVTRNAKTFSLSAREMRLIDYFVAHRGEVLTRDDLLNAAWGVDYLGTTRTLDQHIAQLRKKIEERPGKPRRLLTVHGIGYRLVAPPGG